MSDLQSDTPQKHFEAGYDVAYDEYLKAQSITNVLGTYIKVEGGDLEKDFNNIYTLATIVQEEQEMRAAHLDIDELEAKYGTDKQAGIQEWKPATERQGIAFDCLRKLLNDVDIAINKEGNGETFGVSYFLDGDKVEQMENDLNVGDDVNMR
ncbi:hypothetical protein GJU40_15000 [Bacillus lacus]|uniref:Uncharacterized protein n=1 Tax=Metabacillus lacus TaxID=1983721 RepID=A0A7X2J149_9BACI|nr:hypothetical protein [Metabacillus lacus]MRX73450.1 hypothetical protein [Metabacillus lacus]